MATLKKAREVLRSAIAVHALKAENDYLEWAQVVGNAILGALHLPLDFSGLDPYIAQAKTMKVPKRVRSVHKALREALDGLKKAEAGDIDLPTVKLLFVRLQDEVAKAGERAGR